MIFEQKYLTLESIEAEFHDKLNSLLIEECPNIINTLYPEEISLLNRNYYYLFFNNKSNQPIGYFKIKIKLPNNANNFFDKLKNRFNKRKKQIQISCHSSGVTGNYLFSEPQFEIEINKKIETIIKTHLNEFDSNLNKITFKLISSQDMPFNFLKTEKVFCIPKTILKSYINKAEFEKNSRITQQINSKRVFEYTWNNDECIFKVDDYQPEKFLKIKMVKSYFEKSSFCYITTNLLLNDTIFFNIYMSLIEFLYSQTNLNKIHFINFGEQIDPYFMGLTSDFLDKLNIQSGKAYLQTLCD